MSVQRHLRIASVVLLVCAGVFLTAQESGKNVWDGVYTTDQSKRGEAQYAKECAGCHGDLLTGGEQAPPLVGPEFMANWNGLSAGELFERIRKTMPMNKPGKLSREVNADILAYMLAMNKFPAGKTELSSKTEMLNTIRIEATKSNEGDKK